MLSALILQSRMMTYASAVLLSLIILANLSQGQIANESNHSLCSNKISCGDCIQTKNCAWCLQPNYNAKPRCFEPSLTPYGGCPEEYTMNPDNMERILQNKMLTLSEVAAQPSFGGNIVQIAPQKVSLKLRTNEAYHLNFRYSQVEDYPVDLYYLMDLSTSTGDYRQKLSNLGDLLSDTMRNITSNFRVGFGSYVDKVSNMSQSCENCNASYGYKNHMRLSKDIPNFNENVRKTASGGMMNVSEGENFHFNTLDAMMQALVCREQIGWRHNARRLLVLSTNNSYLSTDHGMLRDAIVQNDRRCHLDSSGKYNSSTVFGHPSISQINSKVTRNVINVIFAVTPEQVGNYENLARNIEGSSIGVLSEDSSNVVELVKEQYNKISSDVEMRDNTTNAIQITYYSTCLRNGAPVPTSKCYGLKIGDIVSFTAEIVVTSCPQNPKDWFQTFKIYPVGINESLIVDLEMLCRCDCEKPNHPQFEFNSQICSGHGTYKCGICDCDDSHFGRKCECSIVDVHRADQRYPRCRADNSTLIDCNGRGQCVCGICECDKRSNAKEMIYGQYCECDNFSCERDQGQLCGGADHGSCDCGHCICKPGWTGDDCTCRASNDTCMPPSGRPNASQICSGHGECICGACKCQESADGRHSGEFCEKCPTCSGFE